MKHPYNGPIMAARIRRRVAKNKQLEYFKSSRSLCSLPGDVLYECFAFIISSCQDVITLAATCRLFRKIVEQPGLVAYLGITLENKQDIICLQLSRYWGSIHVLAPNISIPILPHATIVEFQQGVKVDLKELERLPFLKKVFIYSSQSGVTWEELVQLAKRKSLVSLGAPSVVVTQPPPPSLQLLQVASLRCPLVPASLSGLQHLDIAVTSSHQLAMIMTAAPHLIALQLQCPPGVWDIRPLRYLRRVAISQSEVPGAFRVVLPPSISTLCLVDCRSPTTLHLPVKNLESFVLRGKCDVDFFISLTDLLEAAQNLSTLHLINTLPISYSAVAQLGTLPNLTSLYISRPFDKLSLQPLQNLKRLAVQQMSRDAIPFLYSVMTLDQLQHFECMDSDVTHEDLHILIKSLPNLGKVTLQGCPNVDIERLRHCFPKIKLSVR